MIFCLFRDTIGGWGLYATPSTDYGFVITGPATEPVKYVCKDTNVVGIYPTISENVISLMYISNMYFDLDIKLRNQYPVLWQWVRKCRDPYRIGDIKGNFLTFTEPLRFVEEVQPLVFSIP